MVERDKGQEVEDNGQQDEEKRADGSSAFPSPNRTDDAPPGGNGGGVKPGADKSGENGGCKPGPPGQTQDKKEGTAVSGDDTGAPEPQDADREPLEVELRNMKEQLQIRMLQVDELTARLQRMQADFENFRKRTQKEKEELHDYAVSGLIEKLLPVLDNFERALASGTCETDAAFREGVAMILSQFQKVLAKEGLESWECVGEAFDPQKHEAVLRVKSEAHEDNTVVEELQRGYIFKDRVVRPSMVKVSSKS